MSFPLELSPVIADCILDEIFRFQPLGMFRNRNHKKLDKETYDIRNKISISNDFDHKWLNHVKFCSEPISTIHKGLLRG